MIPMRLDWSGVATAHTDDADGTLVELLGFPATGTIAPCATHFLLLPEAPCCAGCLPGDPTGAVEVFAAAPVPLRLGALRLQGRWQVAREPRSWHYRLQDARTMEAPGWRAVTRRGVLAAGPLMCLATCARAEPQEVRAVLAASPAIDIHSHAGGIAGVTRMRSGVGFSPIADPMRAGGLAVACLAVVSDGPTHHIAADGLIHPYRTPEPGELAAYGALAFRRLQEVAHAQGLAVIADAVGLRAARAGVPSAIIAAEGADFLEGRLDGLADAHARWTLRHLQLTHYRVNELGDIQTEAPVHDGLTDFGADVVRACNRLGIVVDVAHGTLPLVRRAAAVTTKPLVLSHTSLTRAPGPRSRQISVEHAKVIAGTGGVIGVWPPASIYPTLPAMAAGMARLVDAVGIDHVGLGTDLRGLVGPSVLPDYDALPGLAEALLAAGFNAAEMGKLLGGNYARVFLASVG
ncbi:MAG: membrane dipeptidase [Acetobacteraceae bacterium]|nr:membrane dipeptidase [Acetobacteraceae bacterium]